LFLPVKTTRLNFQRTLTQSPNVCMFSWLSETNMTMIS